MAEYLIQEETLTNIADKVRAKAGIIGTMSPSEIETNVGNILTPTDGSIPTKTVSDIGINYSTITVPSGYYASQESVVGNFYTDTFTYTMPAEGGALTLTCGFAPQFFAIYLVMDAVQNNLGEMGSDGLIALWGMRDGEHSYLLTSQTNKYFTLGTTDILIGTTVTWTDDGVILDNMASDMYPVLLDNRTYRIICF